MRRRLDEKAIKYAIAQREKGKGTADIASELKVSQRHVQRLCAEYRETGVPHAVLRPGRGTSPPPPDHVVRMVLQTHDKHPDGAVRTARRLRRDHDISYLCVYRILKENGRVTASPAKSRRRKWVFYERKHSNAMWHVDWHDMKHPRFQGLKLVTYLDDASRCVTTARLFKEATSENAVAALEQAIERFGTPATILSDNGSCFVGRNGRRKGAPNSWVPTAFEAALLDRGIELINSRPYHPQTNGKLERFHRTVEEEIGRFESLSAYIEYYNTDRLHWSLDIDNYETPILAFGNKAATEEIRKNNPKWMREDTKHGAT